MKTDDEQFRPPSSESLEAGYETSGVNVKALAWFVVGLVAFGAVIHLSIWLLLDGFVHSDEETDRSYSALSDKKFMQSYNENHGTTLPVSTPPAPRAPRIQPSKPEADLQAMYQGEDEVFRRMGWKVDDQTHAQVELPAKVISAVIRDASRRQQQEKQPR